MIQTYVVTKEDEEVAAHVTPSFTARPFVAKLIACERQLIAAMKRIAELELK